MASNHPVRLSDSIQFGEDFDLDLRTYELRRAGRVLKLERIPVKLLILLIEGRGQLVTRDQIIERIWGKDVFLDTDNSINAAIRKIRQVLKDDPEQPRFVQTIIGRLAGALLLEQNDEWQLQRRYLPLEGLQSLADNQPARLSAVVS